MTTPATKRAPRKPSATRQKAAAAGAKLPDDHALAAEADGELIAVNVRGFDLSIDPDALGDFRLHRRMARGDDSAMFELFDRAFGDQAEDAIDSLANAKGYVAPDAAGAFLREVIEAAGLGKS